MKRLRSIVGNAEAVATLAVALVTRFCRWESSRTPWRRCACASTRNTPAAKWRARSSTKGIKWWYGGR